MVSQTGTQLASMQSSNLSLHFRGVGTICGNIWAKGSQSLLLDAKASLIVNLSHRLIQCNLLLTSFIA